LTAEDDVALPAVVLAEYLTAKYLTRVLLVS